MFSVGFVTMFTIGGLSGVLHSMVPSDYQQQDTYYVVAHFHQVLVGGALFALFSGIYYWFPKFTGRFLNESLGKVHFWLFFVGMNLTFFPMHFLGVAGMPRRIYTYDSGLGWGFWNMVATIGVYTLAVGMLVFVANFFRALRQPATAPDNPWGGATLEWATSSPPPEHDFDVIPAVRDRDPLWYDRDHGIAPAAPPEHLHIHMPPPSYYPLVLGVGILLVGIGVLSSLAVTALGVVVGFYATWAWILEPTD
jgi:cytochrome c oxidase subunit 1